MSDQPVEHFLSNMNRLNSANINSVLDEVYAEHVTFIDPVKQIDGRDKLSHYFTELYRGVERCQFTLKHSVCQDQHYVMEWQMTLRHKQLAKHRDIVVDGISVLHYAADRVTYQRDYYDLGAMIYEQVPLLGGLIKKIRHGL